jgi:hypothetical protein
VYSGSVLHVLKDRDTVAAYLSNACSALRPGGVIFGSTMETLVDGKKCRECGVLKKDGLRCILDETGFGNIRILRKYNRTRDSHRNRLWFYAVKK